jgi:hypothetical protein
MSRHRPRRDRSDHTATLTLPVPEVAHERYEYGSPGLAAEVAATPAWQPRPATARWGPGDTLENLAAYNAHVQRAAAIPPAAPQRCSCRAVTCPDAHWLAGLLPGSDRRALLSAAPGVAAKMSLERVRNGQWDDIPAEFDDAWARVQKAARNGRRAIARDLNGGLHHIAAVFDANPEWRSDPALAEGLHRMEERLAAGLAAGRSAA